MTLQNNNRPNQIKRFFFFTNSKRCKKERDKEPIKRMVKSKAKPKKEKFLKDINSKLKSDKKKSELKQNQVKEVILKTHIEQKSDTKNMQL